YDSGYPVGESSSSFGDNSYLDGDARDDARLRPQVADLQAFAGRLAETRRNLEAAHAVGVNIRREAFLKRISPGAIFQGVATRAGDQQGTALYIEITGLSEENGVTALLRNAGGWHYARAFQGTWSADDDFQSPNLSLSSPTDQAVRNGGPFLENTQAWAFALRMDPITGILSEENRFYRYRFQFVDSGRAAASPRRRAPRRRFFCASRAGRGTANRSRPRSSRQRACGNGRCTARSSAPRGAPGAGLCACGPDRMKRSQRRPPTPSLATPGTWRCASALSADRFTATTRSSRTGLRP